MEFRPPKERLDAIARKVLAALKESPNFDVRNEAEVIATVRARLSDNLREEFDLEQEVLRMLHQHGQQIYEANADFQKLVTEGKKVLAKKQGFVL